MLRAAKHLVADGERPFAMLRVTANAREGDNYYVFKCTLYNPCGTNPYP